MKQFICFFLFVLIFSKAIGQTQWCGTISTGDPPTPLYELFGPIEIPVFFHIILSSEGEGDVNDSQISNQVSILNSAYSDTYFSYLIFYYYKLLLLAEKLFFPCFLKATPLKSFIDTKKLNIYTFIDSI